MEYFKSERQQKKEKDVVVASTLASHCKRCLWFVLNRNNYYYSSHCAFVYFLVERHAVSSLFIVKKCWINFVPHYIRATEIFMISALTLSPSSLLFSSAFCHLFFCKFSNKNFLQHFRKTFRSFRILSHIILAHRTQTTWGWRFHYTWKMEFNDVIFAEEFNWWILLLFTLKAIENNSFDSSHLIAIGMLFIDKFVFFFLSSLR